MSSLLTLRQNLRQEMRVDPSGRVQADTLLNRNLNQAIAQIQQDGDYNWGFNDADYSTSTVVGQAAYTLPSDFVRIEAGTIKYNEYQLMPVDYRWLKGTNQTLAVNGSPSYYYLRNNNLNLFQRPDAINALEMSYRKQLAIMASDSDDSGLPLVFNEAIVLYAAYLCWNDFSGKEDKAITSFQSYNETMKGLFAQYLGSRDESNFNMAFETTSDYSSTPFYN